MATSLARVFKGLRRLSAKKQLGAQAIRDGHMPVRAGLWIIGPSFSRRWGGQLPAPLNAVKQWYNFRPAKLLRSPIKLSGIVIPPWFARSKASQSTSAYVADVVLVNRAMELVGFDLAESIVMRRSDPSESQKVMSLVDNLRPTYACPRLMADPHGEFIFEELVLGDPFSRAGAADRTRCVAAVLDALGSATAVPLSRELSHQWAERCAPLLADLSGGTRRGIEEELPRIINECTTGWIHGDLSGENIIFRDGRWFVIDFDQVTIGPMFFDLVSLLINEAGWGRAELLDAFFLGDYDAALSGLGVQPGRTEPAVWRAALCAATIGWWCLRGEMTESSARPYLGELLSKRDYPHVRGLRGTGRTANPSALGRIRSSGGADKMVRKSSNEQRGLAGGTRGKAV